MASRNYLFARQVYGADLTFFLTLFIANSCLCFMFVLVISTVLMIAQVGEKSNRFIQFLRCNFYNIWPIVSLFKKCVRFVVIFTTMGWKMGCYSSDLVARINWFVLDWNCARNQKISLLAYFLVSWWSWGILPPRPSYHWDVILRV